MNHPSDQSLSGYRTSTVADAVADAVERHLVGCSACRHKVEDPEWTAESWNRLRSEIRRSPPSFSEKALTRIGVPDPLSHLILTAPAFRSAWWLAIAAALLFVGLVAAASTSGPLVGLPFLTLAPVLPVLGVSVAYGVPGDPLTHIAAVAPLGGFRLLLLRSAAVCAAAIGLTALAAWVFLPADTAFLWLVPALAATTVTFALANHIGAPFASGAVLVVWLMIVAVFTSADTPVRAFSAGPHLLVLAAAIGWMVFSRRLRSDLA